MPEPAVSAGEDASAAEAARLLAAMAGGDAEALDRLYRLWSDTILGIAMRMLNDRSEAEEVMQDLFVRLWHRAGEFDPDRGPAFVWAFTMLRGLCIDRLKYHGRQKRGGGRIVPFPAPAGTTPSVPPLVVASDEMRRIQRAVQALDPSERQCLELAVFLEYTHTEIAAALTTPLGTVKNRLRRALGKLRRSLRRHEL